LACDRSKGNFKFEMLKLSKEKGCFLIKYSNWLDKSIELNAIGFKISVSDLIEQTDFENGYDLADYYLNYKINQSV
jgi:hypothetical protein